MVTPCSLGLGCVTFGREIDQRASFDMMNRAVDRGIKIFDTAAAYAAGRSEEIVGKWLQLEGHLHEIAIGTKILPPYTPASIKSSVDQSLARLRVSKIDILYLHRWDVSCENIEVLTLLDALLRKGKLLALGVSNFSASQLATLVKLQSDQGFHQIKFVQNNHNLAVSDLSPELMLLCSSHSLETVGYSPLGAGFLTGKYERNVVSGSRFDLVPGHQDIYFNERAYQRLKGLQAVALRTGYSPVQLALAWAVHQPVSSVLIGGRKTSHIDQAFEALTFNDREVLMELEDICMRK